MPYLSFIQTLPDIVRQPGVIAALASLGIHGLLALSFPTLSAASKSENQNRGTVKVVELTPAEQNRLPQASPLPPLAYETQPLRSLPSAPLPPLPTNPSLDIPSIRLPPRNSRLNQASVQAKTTQGSKMGIFGNYKLLGERVFAGRKFSIPQRENSKPSQPKTSDNRQPQPANQRNQPVLRPYTFNPNSQPLISNNPASPRPTPRNPNSENSNPEILNSQGGSAEDLKTPPPTIQSPNPQRTADDQNQQQIALADQERQRQLNREDKNTTNEEARQNYLNDMIARRIAEKPEEVTVTGSYPPDACLKELNGTPVVAVAVDAKNNVSNPRLIKSSGYPIFNEKALEDAVVSGKFDNKTGKPKTYLVSVQYEYSRKNCPPSVKVPAVPVGG